MSCDREIIDRVAHLLEPEAGPDATQELRTTAIRRFQLLSAPLAAKAIEDTAFYRYGRLLSRNDVGFDPANFGDDIPAFHRQIISRAERSPHAMLVHRFQSSNHIRRLNRVCKTTCGRPGPD